MYKLVYSDEFNIAVTVILQYSFETFGQKQTELYFEKIDKGLTKISIMPTIGHKRKDLPEPTLAYIIEKHVIIYEIIEESNIIHILRILHSRMDFQSEF